MNTCGIEFLAGDSFGEFCVELYKMWSKLIYIVNFQFENFRQFIFE